MWSPTHVQVTVQRARGLLSKGKNGTNDAFVTIGLGKEKYQTSIKEKALESVEWHEKCELQIPKQGNTAEIVLTVFHHNFLGVDEFLGCINIPLAEMDVYERPRNRWYKLKSKPGKDKGKEGKERGDLEVKVAFIVKSGSLADLSKKEKHKSSLGQLSNALGGSLISISSLDKRKSLKKTLGKIGNKMKIKHKSKETVSSETGSLRDMNKLSGALGDSMKPSQQRAGDADPGVISEGESEDEFTVSDHDQLSRNRRIYEAEGLSRTRRGLTDEDPIGGGYLDDRFDFRNTNGNSVLPPAGEGGTGDSPEQSEGLSLSPTLSNSYVYYEDLEYTKDYVQKERDLGSYSSHNRTDSFGSGLANIEELKENEFDKERMDSNLEKEHCSVNNGLSFTHGLFTKGLAAVGNPIFNGNKDSNLNVMIVNSGLDSDATGKVMLSEEKNKPASIEIETNGNLKDCRLSDADTVDHAFVSLLQEDDDVGLEEVEGAYEHLVQTKLNAGCEEDVNIGLCNSKFVEMHVTDKGYNLSKNDKVLNVCGGEGSFTSYVFDDVDQLVDEFERLAHDCDSNENKDNINEFEPVQAEETYNQNNLTMTKEMYARHKPKNANASVESTCTASSIVNNDCDDVDEEEHCSSQCSESLTCFDTKNNACENFSKEDNCTVPTNDSVNKYSPEQICTLNNDVDVNGYRDGSPVSRECTRGLNRLSGARLVGEIFRSWQTLADTEDLEDFSQKQTMVLDDLSHKGSGYSLETGTNSTPKSGSLENLAGGEFLRKSDVPPAKPPRIINPPEPVDEWEQKLYGKYGKEAMNVEPTGTLQRRINSFNPPAVSSPVVPSPVPSPTPAQATAPTEELSKPSEDKLFQDFKKSPTLSIPSKSSSIKSSMERIIIGSERENDFVYSRTPPSRLSSEAVKKLDGKSREELVEMVIDLQSRVSRQNQQQKDLEDYLDQLLLRVMETSPRILQNPYLNCKTQAKIM